VVAVDLGSNTLRVVEYDCVRHMATLVFEKIVKTADKIEQRGYIGKEALERVIEALKEAQAKIDFEGQEVVAVTTEAMRQASNADEILEQIQKETGVSFHVIDGDEEARLTLLAVATRLKKLQHHASSFVLVDIGGGSTELIFSYVNNVVTKSFPVGIVTLAQRYPTLEALEEALPEVMQPIKAFVEQVVQQYGKVESMVATAGTPTTVAAMKLGMCYATYDGSKVNGTIIEKSELRENLKRLLAMPFEEREVCVGVGRSDLIAAGILIFESLYTILDQTKAIVIDDGLREGVAIDWCHFHQT